MRGRRCVYTVLTGGYERLLPQPAAGPGIDLICFSDREQADTAGWQIRPLTVPFRADPNRSSRRPKILAHEYLADYDESLYLDNTVLLTVDPVVLFDAFLPEGAVMSAFAHSFRATLEDEFWAVRTQGKDAAAICREQLAHYRDADPEVLGLRPVWGGLLLRRHHDPQVVAAMRLWWEHVLRYSRRDQLSLPVAARAAGLTLVAHEVDNRESPYHRWPRDTGRTPGGGAPVPPDPQDQVRALRQRVAALEGELGGLGARLRETAAERDRLARRLLQVEGSRSWRLTAALRASRGLLRPRRPS